MEDHAIPEKLYYKIGEVSQITGVEPYVLRYWESEFRIINPERSRSKQRLYTKKDLETILQIKRLLYEERYTIDGAKRRLMEQERNKARQLSMGFEEEHYRKLLAEIKDDLKALKRILR